VQKLIDAINAPQPERRADARFQPAFGTTCQLLPTGQQGLVWDVSTFGVGMLLASVPDAGTDIPAEFHTDGGGSPIAISLRVMYTRSLSTGDYFVGARFSRSLTEAEIDTLTTPFAVKPSLSVRAGSPKAKGPTARTGLRRAAVSYSTTE